jgi:hypothetical protein
MVGNWSERPWKELERGPRTFLSLFQQRQELPQSILALAEQASSGPGWVDSGGIRWKFPSLTPADPSRQVRPEIATLPSPTAVADASRRLRKLGVEAQERMGRPLIGVASGGTEGHEETPPALPDGRPIAVSRSVALEVGTAIHSALEDWDLMAEVPNETLRQRDRIERQLKQALDPDELAEAFGRVDAILESLSSGNLLRRLTEQPERVVARELPVLSPALDTGSHAIAGISGTIDLVLRDDESDGLVVIDFKTDDISATEDLDQYADRYVQQISTYSAALQDALELPQRPRAELWFVACDRVWRSS